MEVRRIISLGRSSQVISLPKQWLEYHKLKKGDAISLSFRKDGSLVLFPASLSKTAEEENRHKEIVINSNEKITSLIRKIVGCYLNGYKSISIKSEDLLSHQHQKCIRDIAKTLYLQIMDSSSKYMYLESPLKESEISLNAIIRRVHSITCSMHESVIKALEDRDLEAVKSILVLDDDVDQFSFFLMRILRKAIQDPLLSEKLKIEPLECLDYQMLVDKVENTADCAARIAKSQIFAYENGKNIPAEIVNKLIELGMSTLEAYDSAVSTFFSEDQELADVIIDEKGHSIREKSREISKSLPGVEDPYVVCVICSIQRQMERVGEYSADIAEMVINRSLR